MIRTAFTLLLMAFMAVVAIAAVNPDSGSDDEMIVQVETTKPMTLQNTKDAAARFKDLGQSGIQFGMENIRLMGTAKYTGYPDGRTGVDISWHTVKITEDGKSLTQTLTAPLTSSFDVPPKNEAGAAVTRVDPLTSFDAQGNLNELLQIINDLKKKLAEKNQAKQSEEYLTNKEEQTTIASPTGTTSGSSDDSSLSWPETESITTSSDDDDDDDNDGTVTDVVWDSYETCPPRIDESEGILYLQQRGVETDSSGTVTNTGTCEDSGETVVGATTTDGCAPLVDEDGGNAYETFRVVATWNNTEYEISACSADTEKAYALQTSTADCSVRVDFADGLAYQQQQLYYLYGSNKVTVGDCRDSDTTYAIQSTSDTCEVKIDEENSKVYDRTRSYYEADGERVYVSECKVDDDQAYELTEQYCDPKFEHNLETGESYYITEVVYTDSNSETHTVEECSISTDTSFSQKEIACGYEHNDDSLFSFLKTFTMIEGTVDGNVTIVACRNNSDPIPYALTGSWQDSRNFTESGTWDVPAGLSEIRVIAVGGGCNGGDSGPGAYASDCGGSMPSIPGDDGGGANGGSGASAEAYLGMGWSGGGGGGGAAGEIKNQTLALGSEVQGTTINIHVGGKCDDTVLGDSLLTARGGYGAAGGNAGGSDGVGWEGGTPGDGWGDTPLCGLEYLWGQGISGSTVPACGLGYGAGGWGGRGPSQYMGGCSGPRAAEAAIDAAQGGIIHIEYNMLEYLRADGSTFTISGSGD